MNVMSDKFYESRSSNEDRFQSQPWFLALGEPNMCHASPGYDSSLPAVSPGVPAGTWVERTSVESVNPDFDVGEKTSSLWVLLGQSYRPFRRGGGEEAGGVGMSIGIWRSDRPRTDRCRPIQIHMLPLLASEGSHQRSRMKRLLSSILWINLPRLTVKTLRP